MYTCTVETYLYINEFFFTCCQKYMFKCTQVLYNRDHAVLYFRYFF